MRYFAQRHIINHIIYIYFLFRSGWTGYYILNSAKKIVEFFILLLLLMQWSLFLPIRMTLIWQFNISIVYLFNTQKLISGGYYLNIYKIKTLQPCCRILNCCHCICRKFIKNILILWRYNFTDYIVNISSW